MPDDAIERLRHAIRHPTISGRRLPLQALHAELARDFPRVHAAFDREVVGTGALLFTEKGQELGGALVLAAHQDVVPVEPGTEADWEVPPFSGEVQAGYIWGRGAVDDKGSMVAILEALEGLLAQGFEPQRPIVLAFGHDEEVDGFEGAGALAQLLRNRSATPWMVLDEGGAVTHGTIPGVRPPVALVGIAEKGYVSVALSAAGQGGHSSMPPEQTAVGIVADAVRKLEAAPMPARLAGATRNMIDTLSPHMGFGSRLVLANLWAFEGLATLALAAQPTANATVRTTTAVTMIEGGTKDNVLPARARAVVNYRILPGDTVDEVLDHVHEVVDDGRVTVEPVRPGRDPSPESSVDSDAYAVLSTTIRQVFPGALVAPYLVVGGTDARYYRSLCESTYRFVPIAFADGDRERIHGSNERVSVEGYRKMVRFYGTLIVNAAG